MKNDPFSEKRKYARLALRSIVVFRVLDKKGKPASERSCATGKNIGAAGILFISPETLAPGTMLTMEISLPGNSAPIDLKGKVKWCIPSRDGGSGKFDIGVEFTNIGKEHLRLLVEYVCGSLSGDILKNRLSDPRDE